MLFLLFRLGKDVYALAAEQVVEVLPLVHIKHLPQAPLGVAGVFVYRGAPIPIIDLSELALGRPSSSRLSTRVIVVRHATDADDGRLLGLIAENTMDTIRRDPSDFVSPGIDNPAAPYLGPVTITSQGMIQRVDISKLLPPSIYDLLFNLPMVV